MHPRHQTIEPQWAALSGGLPGKRMPLAVALAPRNLTAQGDDFRVAVELFPPALTTPALHAFETF
jgi:hypothetical protein